MLAERPAAFAWWEGGEERLRAQIGDHPILRDRRGGTTKVLTLRQLRSEVQCGGDPTLFDADDRAACGCMGFDDE